MIDVGLDCGDVSDVTKNDGVFGDESECGIPCPGDPTTICGSGNRLTTYYWNGVMNNWHTPANIGRYEVCQRTIHIGSSLTFTFLNSFSVC